MDILFTMDRKDYNESWPHTRRTAVRAVIQKGDKLAMVYSVRDDYFKFPGGGMEEHEDHRATLAREVLEEVGLSVIPATIEEFGQVIQLQKRDRSENTVFEQQSFYYFCDTEDSISEQELDLYEAESGFTLRYVTIDEAIRVNSKHIDVDFVARDTAVLRLLRIRRNLQ